MTTRLRLVFTTALGLLLSIAAAPLPARASAAAEKRGGAWRRVTSKNFTLVGDASEEQMRRVALRLEQFRKAFSLFSPGSHLGSGVPVNVVVFRDDAAFAPFKPPGGRGGPDVAGYFAAGPEVNFIALAAARRSEDPYSVIFHEYAHLLARNNMRNTPAWLGEGLAEYYSTFQLTEGRSKVLLGRAVRRHARSLRRQRFIPLRRLLEADSPPHDGDSEQTGLFYAQSWALVHYLLHGRGPKARAEFETYLRLLDRGEASGEEAFRRAFGVVPEMLEPGLRLYVEHGLYASQEISLDGPLESETELHATAIDEAEWEAHLGDLLLHVKRLDAAEGHLLRSLSLDPELAYARASLGALRLKQGREDEAVAEFGRAARSARPSHLAHYRLAQVMAGVAGEGERWLAEPTPERNARIRAELDRAIALAPDFAPAYELLALVNLLAGERLDESIELVRRAAQLAPGRPGHTLTLAELHLRKKEYAAARTLVAPLASAEGGEARDRARARALLETIETAERVERERRASGGDAGDAAGGPAQAPLRRAREGESQGLGFLLDIECPDAGGVHLRVRLDDGRTLRLHKGELRRISFVTYTADVKRQIECGERAPANRVLITYRPAPPPSEPQERAQSPRPGRRAPAPAQPAQPQTDGEAVAVDFIPTDWK